MTFTVAPGAGSPVDFVRVYVGRSSRSYDVSFDLRNADLRMRQAVASEPGLARILNQPGEYFIALTAVDTSGRESDFSNELRVDTRTQRAAWLMLPLPSTPQPWSLTSMAEAELPWLALVAES